MKIISWNVNGLRAVVKKGFYEFIDASGADIICLQEIKMDSSHTGKFQFGNFPYVYWNSADRPGYSGTAILSKVKPIAVSYGINAGEADDEGRVITAEFESNYLVTVYTPNAKDDLSRVPLRHKKWDPAFLTHCKNLEAKKPVIFCGDLNVAHQEIDLKNAKQNIGKKGFTAEEREGFSNFVAAGFVDTFRTLYPTTVKYSWWSMMAGARARNAGWRIDYFLVSKSLMPVVKEAFILNEIMGSDHCPVGIELK